jgi:hypothetical protein
MTSYTGFGPSRNIGNEYNVSGTYSWSEVLSKVLNKHSLKFGFNMQVSRNLNALPVANLALGNALNTQMPNPFVGLLPQAPTLNGATVTQQQLLLPFPQFQTVTQNDLSIGYASYDSLQMKVEKRFSQMMW